jgi:hypothetical protein
VRNDEALHRVKWERNILYTIKRKKANCIGHILRRHCVLKHITEGQIESGIEMTGTQGRKRKQLLGDFKKTTGYCKMKEEASDCTVWRTGSGRGCETVVRETAE